MRSTEGYLELLTNEHRNREKFRETVALSVDPLAGLQGLLAGMPAAFDLDTAVGRQLDTVGLWIGRTRNVYVPIEGVFFSWDTVPAEGWDQGVWQGEFEGGSVVSVLSDAQFRKLLYGKVAANNWRGDRAGQYEILRQAFGANGSILILDPQDMSQTVLINTGALTAVERALVEGGYLPIKPAGVRVNFEDYYLPPWEFTPFFGGTYLAGDLLHVQSMVEQVVFGASDWLEATAYAAFTSESTFLVKLNGVTIGTATFPAGGVAPVTATVALASEPTIAFPGDILSIEAPAVSDPTGGDVGLSLLGTRIPTF